MRQLVVLALIALLTGCEKSKGELGTDTATIGSDTAVLKEAQAAADEVLRNAGNCDAAKPSIAEAQRKLDEAAAKVRTAPGRASLNALKTQVGDIARNCP